MTGSEVIEAEMFPESGLISYGATEKKIWNHITNLSAKGWEIYEELLAEKAEKKGRGKK